MTKKQWTDEEIDTLKKMFFEDKSDKEIAEAMHLDIGQIKNKIKNLQLTKQHKRPSRVKDLLEQRFGRLVVTGRAPNIIYDSHRQIACWYCDCDCGTKNVVVTGYQLRSGHTQSCGCLFKEMMVKRNTSNRTQNDYIIDEENNLAIGITSTKDKFAIDLDDFEKIRPYKWHCTQDGYLQAHDFDERRTTIRLSRIVMDVQGKDWTQSQVDHINHDLRDNRKCNLRVTSAIENGKNKNYKFVSYSKSDKKWIARYTIDGKRISLGSYNSEEEALNVIRNYISNINDDFSYQKSMELAKQNGFVDFDKYIFN